MSIDGVPDHGWQASAACASVDPELFFPEQGALTKDAKRVCAGCPVKAPCLAYAIAAERAGDVLHGVWAGLSQRDRARLRPGYRGAAA